MVKKLDMGSSEPPPYRDDPDALSLHTTGADALNEESDIPDVLGPPPSYTDAGEEGSAVAGNTSAVPSNLHVFRPYKNINGVDVIMDSGLDTDPKYLEDTIRRWAKTPPAQMVCIRGTHEETTRDTNNKSDKKTTVTDFDLKLRLTEYLFNVRCDNTWKEFKTVENAEKTYRGGWRKTAAPAAKLGDAEVGTVEKPGLTEWAHRFCASHSHLKTFRLTRTVVGLDTSDLKERLESLIRNTNYRGRVCISFPIENRAVDVYSSTWENRWRLNGFIKFLFCITFLWIFSWPWLHFRTRRFHVVKVIWPFSVAQDEIDDPQPARVYATLSEKQWFERWAGAIERAALAKRQATLIDEDREIRPGLESLDTGHSGLNATIRFMGAAYTEVNRQVGWGGDC